MKAKIFFESGMIFLLIFISTLPTVLNAQETGSFTDSRDGKVYQTVKIGEQWMMAENFAYKPVRGNFWAFNNDSGNVSKYGYLYDWETAKKEAPEGWHLPTRKEWKSFRKSLGGTFANDRYDWAGGTTGKVYKKMVEGGSSGFNALFGGIYIVAKGEFRGMGDEAYFWSSSDTADGPWYYSVTRKSGEACMYSYTDRGGGKSVRYFKD